ncbi:hypothetical protein Scep_014549 [Stephania cephalantha]|uniref:Uncharacterized protein n=1 Tax=Stephania cephalantha TaxID=152367 RepID=A0AAP0J3C9_9MAGN
MFTSGLSQGTLSKAVVWWIPSVSGVDLQPRMRGRCVKVVEEGTGGGGAVSEIKRRLLYMAWSKSGVSRERVYGKSKRTEQAVGTSDIPGGRKPQTTSYRKEKQQATKKEVASAHSPRGDGVQDEALEVHERDLHIALDESGGRVTSGSSESREKGPTDEENRSPRPHISTRTYRTEKAFDGLDNP